MDFKHFTIIRRKLWRALLPDKYQTIITIFQLMVSHPAYFTLIFQEPSDFSVWFYLACMQLSQSSVPSLTTSPQVLILPSRDAKRVEPRQQAYNKMRYFCLGA